MTVSYQYEVASSTSGGFTRLLFMWRGSLYKLIYRELLLFVTAFGILSAVYRNIFTDNQKEFFERVVLYCDTFINLIPLSFVLGFYVSFVASRWWQQYMAIPWPDKLMHSIALYVNGYDDHGRMARRTLMRYLNVSLILVLRSISSAVKRRFPTLEHLVESGFMTPVELEMYQSVPSVEFNTYWIPCTWFISLLKESKKIGRIPDSQGLKIIMEEFNEYRSKCGMLWSYDWVSLPLVYTQVVTIATYSFFLAALIGRQYIGDKRKSLQSFQMEIDIFIPIFTMFQFLFYMGLLKVAEQLINPFGDDDEDFELNWLIDRHTKVSYLGVDILMTRAPPLVKDLYFDEVNLTLPYTEAAVAYKKKTYRGSVHNMQVPEAKHTMFLPEIIEEDEERVVTPKSSVHSLHNSIARPTPGIWRTRPPSSQNLFKTADIETGNIYSSGEESMFTDFSTNENKKDAPLKKEPRLSCGSIQDTIKSAQDLNYPGNMESMKSWPSSSTISQTMPQTFNQDQYSDVSYASAIGGWVAHFDKTGRKSDLDYTSQILKEKDKAFQKVVDIKAEKSKMKSIPKLMAGANKKISSTPGKKKGVRWKPIVADSSSTLSLNRSLSQLHQDSTQAFSDSVVLTNLEEIDSDSASATVAFPSESNFYEKMNLCEEDKREQKSEQATNSWKFSRKIGTYSAPCLVCKERVLLNKKHRSSWQKKLGSCLHVGNKNIEELYQKETNIKETNTQLNTDTAYISQSLPNLISAERNIASFQDIYKELRQSKLFKVDSLHKAHSKLTSSTKNFPTTFPTAEDCVQSGPHDSIEIIDKTISENKEVSRKNSEIPRKSNVEECSWHSADWSTLLESESQYDGFTNLNTGFYIHAKEPGFFYRNMVSDDV